MWKVATRREMRPLIDGLKGKEAGYKQAYEQLEQDPCVSYRAPSGELRPFAYRISGRFGEKICGTHLKRGYRIAFTLADSDDDAYEGIVEILYVGTRDTRNRSRDVWDIVHDLFGEPNPRQDHDKPPCCENGLPNMSEDEILEFMNRLRKFLRGR